MRPIEPNTASLPGRPPTTPSARESQQWRAICILGVMALAAAAALVLLSLWSR